MAASDPQAVVERVLAGDQRTVARLMRDIDDRRAEAIEALKLLYPHTGHAHLIGITGSPGVGKSTLTDSLVTRLRKADRTVGVVAVDPTSPFTGGAILGDRIRMQRHATDEGVFIRSLATRGAFGGLTASTRGVVAVLDAMGKDVVLVETVGVGQDEVDIARMADTTVIATAPGLGDGIQAIKAGILEVGDIFVVNKMDAPGAARTVADLNGMLSMQSGEGRISEWNPPVLLTDAIDGRGLDELIAATAEHREVLRADGGRLLKERHRSRARMEILGLVQARALDDLHRKLGGEQGLDRLAEAIAQGDKDPYTICDEIMGPAGSV